MAFELFDKRSVPKTKTPQVTVQKKGTLSINRPAYEGMGSPERVNLLFDRDSRLIGIRQATEESHSYPLRKVGQGNSYLVSGGLFVSYYDIPCEVARRYDAEVKDEMVVVDLKQQGEQVVSNRNKGKLKREEADGDNAPST